MMSLGDCSGGELSGRLPLSGLVSATPVRWSAMGPAIALMPETIGRWLAHGPSPARGWWLA